MKNAVPVTRSARLQGIEPSIIPSLEKDEVFMNEDADRVKALIPSQPVSRSLNLVDNNPRLVICNIYDEEVTPEVWSWWVERSRIQDPQLPVFHPKVVRFAKSPRRIISPRLCSSILLYICIT